MNRILLLGFSILLLSCSKEANPKENEIQLNFDIGRNDYNLEIDGSFRNFIIHVPNSYDESTETPVVFMLHGSSQNGERFYNISGWVEKAEQNEIITIYPTAKGYEFTGKSGLTTRWSTVDLEDIVVPGTVINDDVVFITEILNRVKASFNIDEERVYAVGFSNGGAFIRNRLYNEVPELFTAFATTGSYFITNVQDVASSNYKSLYSIIGNKDPNLIGDSGSMEDIPLDANDFLSHPFYGPMALDLINQLKLQPSYIEEPNPPKYNLIQFSDSQLNYDNELQFMIVNGLTHVYPNGTNNISEINATNLFWEWFQQL